MFMFLYVAIHRAGETCSPGQVPQGAVPARQDHQEHAGQWLDLHPGRGHGSPVEPGGQHLGGLCQPGKLSNFVTVFTELLM